jgi:hypothetical protein
VRWGARNESIPYGAHRGVYSRARHLHRVSAQGGVGVTQVTIGEEHESCELSL